MKQIPLTKGQFALVDDEDFEALSKSKWCLSSSGYAITSKTVQYKVSHILMHRVITGAEKGLYVDHIDMNKLNNQKANLRACTNAQNQMNKNKLKGKSKYKGVTYIKKANKWAAQIRANYKYVWLGQYHSEEEAALAYNVAAIEHHGEFAMLNVFKDRGV